ncbi:hypothetical protein Cus16_0091 [Curtobacterium sp. ER1/6]|nr:hypothetical protein Cus16_0091 [Curtobacterium sp. ER1/6]
MALRDRVCEGSDLRGGGGACLPAGDRARRGEAALQVAEQVGDVLDADRQTDQPVADPEVRPLGRGAPGVRRGRRVEHERADVAEVGHPAEQLDRVDERASRGLAAGEREREDGAGPAGQVALCEVVVRTGGETRVVDARHLRLLLQEGRDGQRVRAVAFDAQRQGLDALAEQERVERRRRRADPGGDDVAGVDHEGPAAVPLDVALTAEGPVRCREVREALKVAGPVEPAAVDDEPAEAGTVPGEELRGGVHDDVGAVLDRPDEVRRRQGVVDDERHPGPVRGVGDPGDVEDVVLRVRDRLGEEELRVRSDRARPRVQVALVGDEVDLDAEAREVLQEQALGALVDAPGAHHVVAGLEQPEQRDRHRGLAAADEDRLGAPLQQGDAALDVGVRRVAEPGVRVAVVGAGEAVAGLLEVVEEEPGRHVDRGHPCAVCGVGQEAAVHLFGREAVAVVRHGPLLVSWVVRVLSQPARRRAVVRRPVTSAGAPARAATARRRCVRPARAPRPRRCPRSPAAARERARPRRRSPRRTARTRARPAPASRRRRCGSPSARVPPWRATGRRARATGARRPRTPRRPRRRRARSPPRGGARPTARARRTRPPRAARTSSGRTPGRRARRPRAPRPAATANPRAPRSRAGRPPRAGRCTRRTG